MQFVPGAPMNISAAPPGWQVTFTTGTKAWSEPIVGWAVVATAIDGGAIDSDLAPVVLDSEGGYIEPLSSYLDSKRASVSQPVNIKYSIEYRHPGA